jgi:phosphoribosylaminoimidazolecarboxamide formyltransferase/IMP cyclohydrolase
MTQTSSTHPIRRALISVSDKFGIADFARALHDRGIQILSTGGTASLLASQGIPVTNVSEITGFPEIMDGRVKTLHPKIHGGLLAVLDNPHHQAQMQEHGIESIDMVVVNLYPFEYTVQQEHSTFDDIIENIDIGGPAMVRASAKNYRWTAILTSPQQYDAVLNELQEHNGCLTEQTRFNLAHSAFQHTAHYDTVIAQYLAPMTTVQHEQGFAPRVTIALRKEQALRYGENPHQQAGLYAEPLKPDFASIYTQLHGKELSYNNIIDIDAAVRLASEFTMHPAVTIIKHTNPCGVAIGDSLTSAYRKAFASDTRSPFGGIIACTRPIDMESAHTLDEIFTEVLIAPSFHEDALEFLQKKKNRRLVAVNYDVLARAISTQIKTIAGGYLLQTADTLLLDETAMRVVTKRVPTDEEHAAMMFAWKTAKYVKSNAIVYATNDRVLGIGAGQMSRVDSAMIAVEKAKLAGIELRGSAVASDAFFPFADGLMEAVQAGATCVIQPGGSVRDEEVIEAANEHDIAMILTGMRHFAH